MSTPTPFTADAHFSDAWLTLREPADHRARDAQLTHAADHWLAQRANSTATLVDLGCGSGSNLRYLAPRLRTPQHWLLVDHDASLLEHARSRCDELVSAAGEPIQLTTQEATLAQALDDALDGADLITASALFDLVSAEWIDALAARCREFGCAVLFTLSVDGEIHFQDSAGMTLEDNDDRFVFDTLAAHQQRDKGVGEALGTLAPSYLKQAFLRHGYHLREAPSAWRLGRETWPLIDALMAGWRTALLEQAPAQATRIENWYRTRLSALDAGRLMLTLGHRDLLALPPESTPGMSFDTSFETSVAPSQDRPA
ncbi:class I SAM-dependent methyltransferase [Salinicola endophyticus]|uniref:Class I SAM-dependent methyltransferase n=1 Tax=Salinicola endophyticus TaxID=1949083 RepID=A0ABY8FB27_9GAMM|nr:class I SAM-dependent methyltransferase [Salinicola endophyticus]WFF40024.1 class I SAM-dependent methyltransferase [Salinicola endophyticus]